MTQTATLLSIQVGVPTEYPADDHGKAWSSSIAKTPVDGPVWMRTLNIAGDEQTDLVNHGGADKAVLVYGEGRYPYWRDDLPDLDWVHGAFGENLTVSELDEDSVCIGDTYKLGAVIMQVSQPRSPCWKLARRWKQKDLTARVYDTGYTGWYVRVLNEGEIAPGMSVELVERPHPGWSVMRTTRVLQDKHNITDAHALAELPELTQSWREYLAER